MVMIPYKIHARTRYMPGNVRFDTLFPRAGMLPIPTYLGIRKYYISLGFMIQGYTTEF